jgi:NADPH:quinone reductase-like Zn-dependent oxidoreductase
MKAIVYTEYGQPDVLHLMEVEQPVPAEDEALVKVHAASVNDWDWHLLTGKPFLNRIGGLRRPANTILGCDISGFIESVGKNVTRFQPGDEVFGDLCTSDFGAFAEYACARESSLAHKSPGMTFEQAAAMPQAGLLALQGLEKGRVQSAKKVLFNGGGGGVGSFGIQIAKSHGAEVTGVDSARKHEMMGSLGADNVIDYKKEDFTKNGHQYDLILDVACYRSFFDYKRALTKTGTYVLLGGSMARALQLIFTGPLISALAGRRMTVAFHKPNKGLATLNKMFEEGKLVPHIDKTYKLSEVQDAFRYFGKSQHRGKLVIKWV